uniref:Neuritin 1 n=1 Tax=Serinus canaria TaxID=9135 RepID=A0A8C9NFA8_SERCA
MGDIHCALCCGWKGVSSVCGVSRLSRSQCVPLTVCITKDNWVLFVSQLCFGYCCFAVPPISPGTSSGAPRGGGGLCPQRCRCSLRPPVLAGHLAGLLAAGPACADAYRGLSDCVLKLGDSMATYEEEEGLDFAKGLTVWCLPGCRYWDEFHTCALTVLWECQKEAAAVWEMLRRESRKNKFQGSLFDLCSPSMAQSSAWTHVPNISILSIPLIVTWLNL